MDAALTNEGKYTRDELLQGYQMLKNEIFTRLFGKDLTPTLKVDKGLARIDSLMQTVQLRSGLDELQTLKASLKELTSTITGLLNGKHGEITVERYLHMLELPHRQIKNACFCLGGKTEECDQIVITKKYVIIIEIKWRNYQYKINEHGQLLSGNQRFSQHLVSSLIAKRSMVRTVLNKGLSSQGMAIPLLAYVVFANERASVRDKSKLIAWCYPGELICRIEQAVKNAPDPNLDMDMDKIEAALRSHLIVPTYRPSVDVEAIRACLDQLEQMTVLQDQHM